MTPSNGDTRAARAYLQWITAAGVDTVLDEHPHDRFVDTARELTQRKAARQAPPPERSPASENPAFAASERRLPTTTAPPPITRSISPRPAISSTAMPNDESVMAARETARAAPDLEALKRALEEFDGCNLKATAKNTVFADGNPQGRVMFIGEAPGRDEDLKGLPFVGRSGQLLDRMLAAVGFDRSSVYIANVVPWRPPGNRTPSPLETEICRPFIERQIELANPDILVFLGGASTKQLLRTDTGITRLRGKWLNYRCGEKDIPAMATLHPAFLLRQPLQKRLAWRDFLAIRRRLDAEPADQNSPSERRCR